MPQKVQSCPKTTVTPLPWPHYFACSRCCQY
jgi:hypothetical protein